MRIEEFEDGLAVLGSFDASMSDWLAALKRDTTVFPTTLVIWDPPYGRVAQSKWDKISGSDVDYEQTLVAQTQLLGRHLVNGGALWAWGGIGRPQYRPFWRYLVSVELATEFLIADLVTWKKKRAYGKKDSLLFVREECAYLVKGPMGTKPLVFNIPYLDKKRGYAGWSEKYPCKSEYLRRTNVWDDISEIFKGKIHEAQKPDALYEVIIQTCSNPGDWILDPMAGSMTTARAARKLGRKWVCIEQDPKHFEDGLATLR